MSRIPPGLLYVTIYNPTLRPQPNATSDDDEDAEEQAQILFYTARERAVSRDRILRQVGLAKALINFSEVFAPEEGYLNVHSQGRRMIMLQPEPNFWIHACLEVAKTPRTAPVKSKKGSKDKGKSKISVPPQEVVYDYHDGSIYDLSLRAHLQHGYELFRLTHGSFASILEDIGQHALELQLERFFTVWAWKWDIEEDTDLTADLGMPLHPQASSLTPLLDELGLAAGMTPFVIAPPRLIPSTAFHEAGYPTCLLGHIISRLPPPPITTAPEETPSSDQAKASGGALTAPNDSAAPDARKLYDSIAQGAQSTLLSVPGMTLAAMDPRNVRWGWPGYLTFGKGTPAKAASPTALSPAASPGIVHTVDPIATDSVQDSSTSEKGDDGKAVEIDAESLLEAMSTSSVHVSSPVPGPSPALSSTALDRIPVHDAGSMAEGATSTVALELGANSEQPNGSAGARAGETLFKSEEEENGAPSTDDPPSPGRSNAGIVPQKEPLPDYLPTTVHLQKQEESLDLRKGRVWHLTSDDLTFAVVAEYEVPAEQLPSAEIVVSLLDAMRNAMANETRKAAADSALPSATKILQPQDRHLVSLGGFTKSSNLPISTKPEHLLSARQIIQSDLDAVEVFSRGQNPQHWHIAKRGFGPEGEAVNGEVFMQIARKESTLTDVDNDLAGVVRRFLDG